MHALHREPMLADHLALQRIEAVEQAHREGRAGSDAAARGDVRIVVDLHAARDFQESERLPDGRMDDLIQRLTVLDLRVDNAVAMLEEGREVATVNVAVLVDRRGQHGAAVLGIPFGIVGAATEEGDPKRGSADDHALPSRPGTTAAAAKRSRSTSQQIRCSMARCAS